MNRRLNGFIKKPHIFVDSAGVWRYNISIGCKESDTEKASQFCNHLNVKGK